MQDIKDKLNEIVDFFKANKQDLLKKDWSDGMSKEYEFAGLTYIESRDGFSILSDYDGTIAALEKDGSTSLDNEFQDEIDHLIEVYAEFQEDKKDYLIKRMNNSTPEKKSKNLSKLITKSNKSQDFKELDGTLNEQLSQIKNADKICSFDMEFADRTGDRVVEVGISIYDRKTNETFSEHFLIEEQVGKYKRNNTPMEHTLMFAHGKTKTVPLEHAMRVLNNAMQNSDVNIIFAQENKHKHMLAHNFKEDSFINVQDLMRMNSRNNMKTALSIAVDEFCSVEQPVKNAGNDAASTLEITSGVFGNRIDLANYKSPIVTDYSEHPKKSSAAEIRQSRKSNPNPIPNDKYTKEEVAKTRNLKL